MLFLLSSQTMCELHTNSKRSTSFLKTQGFSLLSFSVFFFLILLFIWLCQVSAVAHRIFVAACGILRCVTRASLVKAHRPNCSAVCGNLVPRTGIEHISPPLEGEESQPLEPPGKSLFSWLTTKAIQSRSNTLHILGLVKYYSGMNMNW